MSMGMMHVGRMRVLVPERFMPMRVCMRLALRVIERMIMLVM